MDTHPVPIETLLAHRAWVRGVARAIVGDADAADDAEQDAWLAALSSPPRDESAVRGWFRVVLRNRARRGGRTESRRERRETVAARPESTPSAAELAELADTHRRVVQAVVELPEPYRETILLRYFEGLAVDDVAARTSVPLDTARSRISRGLAKLRERLAREFGDEPSLRGALALLVGRRSPAVPRAASVGRRGASRAAWVVAAGAVGVIALGAFVVAARGSARVATPPALAAAQEPAPARPIDDPRAPSRAVAADEHAPTAPAPSVASASTSSATVAPVASSPVLLERLAAAKVNLDWRETRLVDGLGELTAKTGVEIVVAAEALDADKDVTVARLRLDGVSGKTALTCTTTLLGLTYVVEDARVVVVPRSGRRDLSRDVVIPPAWDPNAPQTLTVHGVVVDENGTPAAGARVVGAFGAERERLAETDERGAFIVELRRPFPALVADIRGHAPSLPAAIEGKLGETLDVRLAVRSLAVVVEGHVVDVDGRDVAGARVTIAGADDPPTHGPAAAPEWRTDERGRFHATGLAPGRLTARATRELKVPDGRGLIWVHTTSGTSVVDARPAETVDVELTLGANGPRKWRGTLRDKAGAPIAGAQVWAGGCMETTSGSDGAFLVSGLGPGHNGVLISLPGGHVAHRSVYVDPDFDLDWDPAIGTAWRISGRLVDGSGRPTTGPALGGLWLWPVEPWSCGLFLPPGCAEVKPDGSFAFDDIEPGAYRVQVTAASANGSLTIVESDLIDSARTDVVIRVGEEHRPRARVSGRLVRADGTPYEGACLTIDGLGGWSWVYADKSGWFARSAVPPNRYHLCVQDWKAGQILDLGVRDIGASDVALGTLTFPPQGRAVVAWTPTGVAAGEAPKCMILRVLGDGYRVAAVPNPPIDPTTNATLTLSPGAYVARVTGGGVQGVERAFRVESGADVAVDVPLRAAPRRRIRPNFPMGRPKIAWMRVTDDAGGFVHETLLVGPEFMAPLAPGRFRVEAVVTETITLRGAFDVPADGAPERFDVVLR
jgi:RNA polymerase sigma-70 factor (ECF subfamily)